MRFHATAHDKQRNLIYEYHILARSTGDARKKLTDHLATLGHSDVNKMITMFIEVREDINSELPLIDC